MSSTNNDQPRASTSKEDASEPRASLTATAFHDPLERPPVHPAELRQRVPQPPQNDTDVLAGPTSNLAKLQTYLPTGTWVTYTALQTWAFSLRPGDPPTSPISNCNNHQRIALSIVLSLSALFAFLSSFVKRFIYDSAGTHVLYPPPDLFSVASSVSDPVTRVKFPCRTREKRYCWPLVDTSGEFVYDEKRERLRVVVFKTGVTIHVKRKVWAKRVWAALFKPEEEVPDAPRLSTSPRSKHFSGSSALTQYTAHENTVEIDDVLVAAPTLDPRWTHTLVGVFGGKSYLDFRPRVWRHALVSVVAFLALALFSTQVCGCLYPAIPDYLPSTLQTGMLIILGFVATLFVQDDAVSLGQRAPARHRRDTADGNEVPAHLRGVTEMLVWVGRQEREK